MWPHAIVNSHSTNISAVLCSQIKNKEQNAYSFSNDLTNRFKYIEAYFFLSFKSSGIYR